MEELEQEIEGKGVSPIRIARLFRSKSTWKVYLTFAELLRFFREQTKIAYLRLNLYMHFEHSTTFSGLSLSALCLRRIFS